MTTINPVSMSTPIKCHMPPPDTSSANSNSTSSSTMNGIGNSNNNIPLSNNRNFSHVHSNLKPIAPAPSPNKPSFAHHVAIAAKPPSVSNTSSNSMPLLAAKPARQNNCNSNKNSKPTTCSKQFNQQQQQQQQQVMTQQQQQFQQQIQQFQQLQQRSIYNNGNQNLNNLFPKANNATNPQLAQHQLLAEAFKQQSITKNPSITPIVNNSQIQLNNQQLLQLIANSNGNQTTQAHSALMFAQQQQQYQQPLNKLQPMSSNSNHQTNKDDQSNNNKSNSSMMSTTGACSQQAATIISATTTSDGQIIFQTVPAVAAAAAIAAFQQQQQVNKGNAQANQLSQQNLNQMLSYFQQQNHNQYPQNTKNMPTIAPKQPTDNSTLNIDHFQQEQLKQKLLLEQQRFFLLQHQLEQQKQLLSSTKTLSPNWQENQAKHNTNQTLTANSASSKPILMKSSSTTNLASSSQDLRKSPNPSKNDSGAIAGLSDEVNLTKDMETDEHDQSGQEATSENISSNNNNNTSTNMKNLSICENPKTTLVGSSNRKNNKRRGRPRLYAVNPMTGKSMKGRLLSTSPNSRPKACKSPKFFPNTSVNNTNYTNGFLIDSSILLNTNNIPICGPNGLIGVTYANYLNGNEGNTPTNSNNTFLNNHQLCTTNHNNHTDRSLVSISNEKIIVQNEAKEEENTTENDQLSNEDNTENDNDQEDLTNQTRSFHDEAITESEQKSIQEESNNNQMDCSNHDPKSIQIENFQKINKNSENLNGKMSPVSELSNSISQIKPYRLSPKTMKSQVTLTHVIDGYVIKESSRPFPVRPVKKDLYVDESNLPNINQSIEQEKTTECQSELNTYVVLPMFKCIECGSESSNQTLEEKYCSTVCKLRNRNQEQLNSSDENSKESKKSKSKSPQKNLNKNKNSPLVCTQTNLLPPLMSFQTSASNLIESVSSPLKKVIESNISQNIHPVSIQPLFNISNNLNFTNQDQQQSASQFTSTIYPHGDPTEWNCDEVYQFVRSVSGCIQVAELFKSQEVDGSALSLIRDDHLVNTMQIKLGPALKIMSRFNELRSKFSLANKQNL